MLDVINVAKRKCNYKNSGFRKADNRVGKSKFNKNKMAEMDANHITLEGSDDKRKKFCDAWPTVKSGLQMLADLIKNPIAKGAINVVISAGDTVSGSICGKN